MIPYGRQEITQEDEQAVLETLRSDFITQGPAISEFEKNFAAYCGSKYSIAVSSCTAGLHLSCLALGLSEEDLGVTSPNTFVATANAIAYCRAKVGFIDINPQTYNIDLDELGSRLKSGMRPKVVLPVHFAGHSCDMEHLNALSRQYKFSIIEDAAHCTGASYQGKKVGSCSYSDLTVFSLHPVKIITSGEGGMITTNSEELYEKLILLRTHGITRDNKKMQNPTEEGWYFEQKELGYHYRMTDIQAALGNSQLKRLDSYLEQRRRIACRYEEKLSDLPIQRPLPSDESSWHLYEILLTQHDRTKVYNLMRKAGIGVNVHYIPVHTQPYYKKRGFNKGDFPNAERYYSQALTLPLYPGLTDEQQDYICDHLRKLLS